MQRDEEVWRLANKTIRRERLQIGLTVVAAIVINRYAGDLKVSKQALLLGAAGIAIYIILFELPGCGTGQLEKIERGLASVATSRKMKWVIWSHIFIFIFLLLSSPGIVPGPNWFIPWGPKKIDRARMGAEVLNKLCGISMGMVLKPRSLICTFQGVETGPIMFWAVSPNLLW